MAQVDANLDSLILDAFIAADNPNDISPASTPSNSPTLSPLSSISAESDDDDVEELSLTPSTSLDKARDPFLSKRPQPYVLIPPPPYPTKASPKRKTGKPKTKSAARVAKDKARSHLRRDRKRKGGQHSPPQVKKDAKQKPKERIFLTSLPVSVLVDSEAIRHSGYLGRAVPLPEKRAYSLEELKGDGFDVIRYKAGITQPLLEKRTGSVVGWIAAGPKDNDERPTPPGNQETLNPANRAKTNSTTTWEENCEVITDTIRELRPKCSFQRPALTKTQIDLHRKGLSGPNVLDPRRGITETITWGISTGNGQKQKPQQLRQASKNQAVWDIILNHHAFIRLSGWVSGLFVAWAPLLFLYYANTIAALLDSDSSLSRPFANSVFSAVTVNFGPNTITYPHRDLKNLAFGLCAITAFGNYDWTKGGHLVLFDLKLVIEFPPRTTIFIPSSVLCHANTTIQPEEERYSVVMFSAGGLFRWVEQGFQAANLYWKTKSAAERALKTAERWRSGLAMFSTLQQLRDGNAVESGIVRQKGTTIAPSYTSRISSFDDMPITQLTFTVPESVESNHSQQRPAQDSRHARLRAELSRLSPDEAETLLTHYRATALIREAMTMRSLFDTSPPAEPSPTESSPRGVFRDAMETFLLNLARQRSEQPDDNTGETYGQQIDTNASLRQEPQRGHLPPQNAYDSSCHLAGYTDGEKTERDWAEQTQKNSKRGE
ncbi:hypothetical protein V5O48_009257 [Marasmius crinis-equi]|uniref:Uncharacterized protein n=1 Tax=Marasmius crinis-equi TaxID=585013 RepID=A0ABR3FBK1_9AGAR